MFSENCSYSPDFSVFCVCQNSENLRTRHAVLVFLVLLVLLIFDNRKQFLKIRTKQTIVFLI